MLRLTALLTTFLFAAAAPAQVTNGRAVYERSVSLDNALANLPPGMEGAVMDMPSSFDERAELLFSETASLYRDLVDAPAPQTDGPPTRGVQITFVSGEPEAYHFDRATGRVRQVRTILGKPFNVADEAIALDWHQTGATGTDATTGLPTRAATAVHPDGDTLYADYTPSVALPYGPAEYTGLPGLIVRLRKGRTTVQLQSLEPLGEAPDTSAPNADGKVLTREKFLALRARKEAALMQQASGTQTRVIRQ